MAATVELRRVGVGEHLPHIDPPTRDAINAWLDARDAAAFRVDATEFRVTWIDPAPIAPQFGIEVTFGPHAVLIALDAFAALDTLLVGDPFALMPVTLRDLVLQRLLARFIALLPAGLAESADVRATHWQADTLPNWECRLGFALQRLPAATTSEGIVATESPATLLWLHRQLRSDRPSAATARASLAAPLQIVLGRTMLAPGPLRTLGDGDVVWIETARIARDGLDALLLAPRGSHAWRCRAMHATLRVMPEVATTTSPGEIMNAESSALEIPVTFDLGELSVPLQELERIQPGRLFELPQDVADATVHVRVAGQLIADGKLVVIGRRIGVRISHVRMQRAESSNQVE